MESEMEEEKLILETGPFDLKIENSMLMVITQ